MLEFSKKVLSKVSFDKSLFKKELQKSTRWMSKKELIHLKIFEVKMDHLFLPDCS